MTAYRQAGKIKQFCNYAEKKKKKKGLKVIFAESESNLVFDCVFKIVC